MRSLGFMLIALLMMLSSACATVQGSAGGNVAEQAWEVVVVEMPESSPCIGRCSKAASPLQDALERLRRDIDGPVEIGLVRTVGQAYVIKYRRL